MSKKLTNQKSPAAKAEEAILALWDKEKTFEQSVANRQGQPRFSFNDGPPFANGLPHFGHSLVTAIKDSVLRYKTMRGYWVPRRNGWDCHGLPVEYDVEKDFGISGKKQIEELGIAKFNAACRASIFRYKDQWERFLKRIGRWSDYEHYYATVDTTYTESVWWILGQIHRKGLLYRGFKSLPYCPRCETPLSNFELNEGYKDNVPGPSVYVLFPLADEPKTKLLAWTTTPWTLPANAALAVDSRADYSFLELKSDGSTLILAKKRLEELNLAKGDYKLLKTVKGAKLLGLNYQPLYQPTANFPAEQLAKAWRIYHEDGVSLDEGTGILHVAPRYGEADLNLGLAEVLPLIESVDSSGHLVAGPKEALGRFFKEADEPIIADLTRHGRIFAAETAEHTYPFCWRCDTPLMYFATSTWFIEVTKVKDQMIKTAEGINWVPANIKTGRFGNWLEGARDWAISRNRYWGAPLPVWVNTEDEADYIVVSSVAELEKLAGHKIGDDLHRPYIDEVVIKKDGKTYKRVEEVLDCWFESGSMPAAQWHYPLENKTLFAETFPADFVTEGLDQTRLWFYVQHVIATTLFAKPAFRNVVVNGIIQAADGQKLSKRLRNYPPTAEVFDNEGADAWRLYLLSSVQATETADYLRFRRDGLRDLQRNVMDTLNNSFSFFKTYSSLDKWRPADKLTPPKSDNLLDKWLLARLAETVATSTKSADALKIAHSILAVFNLIDDLSNWYIRRSRRRFWKSQNDADKGHAYATLHYVLVHVCQLLAPWAPFISDGLWRQLTAGMDLPKSVHLSDWPEVNKPDKASQKLLVEMAQIRVAVITKGLAQRAAAAVKVRQPLAKATVHVDVENADELAEIIADELNVKTVEWVKSGPSVKIDTKLTADLKREGLARDLIRAIQNARKQAGFKVEDRIELAVKSDSPEVSGVLRQFKETIFSETLATKELSGQPIHTEDVKLGAQTATIELKRL